MDGLQYLPVGRLWQLAEGVKVNVQGPCMDVVDLRLDPPHVMITGVHRRIDKLRSGG